MTRIAALLLVVFLVGCTEKPGQTPGSGGPPAGVAPPVVDITALDFAFQAPDTVPGGWVTFRLHNAGTELHHGAVYRLDEGKTVADVMKLAPGAIPAWMVAAGGPSASGPGGALETTVQLAPGSYLLVCEIPSPDGKLHFMKGMFKPFTVVEPTVVAAPAAADLTVRLVDFAFEFSRELAAGKHTFRVETAPGQPHEIVIARLAPGKKAEDLLSWVEHMTGPPPIEGVVGGTTALAHGGVNLFQAELAAGDYAIICFLPDVKDGKPHAAHGMMKTVTIS